jgi:hypothetical protein
MVNVLGPRCAADRAHTSLTSQNLLELHLSDLVTLFEVVLAGAAMILNLVLTASSVMARQTVSFVSAALSLVERKFLESLYLSAIRPAPEAVGSLVGSPHLSAMLFQHSFPIAFLRPLIEAELAVTTPAKFAPRACVKVG